MSTITSKQVTAFICALQTHHPEEFDHIFPIVVVKRHVTLRHLTQWVDVLPRCPTMLFSRYAGMQRHNNMDLTDEPPHELDGGFMGNKMQWLSNWLPPVHYTDQLIFINVCQTNITLPDSWSTLCKSWSTVVNRKLLWSSIANEEKTNLTTHQMTVGWN